MVFKIKSLGAAPVFFQFAQRWQHRLFWAGSLTAIGGIFYALCMLEPDAQQGQIYRILFLHVPTAWMSMFLYLLASGYAVLCWIWRTDVSAVMMRAILPTGALMTMLSLVTGSLWGKPTWGTYWVWDARLTSQLLLLFIYLGLMALQSVIEQVDKSDRLLSVAVVIGVVNIPLIYFSVIYWNTLHQGMSVGTAGPSRMALDMRITLLVCVLGVWMLCASTVLVRARYLLADRNRSSGWLAGSVL